MAETGRLNRLEHLWIYESLEERAACRSGLAEDKDWNEAFLPRAFPDLLRQENRFMVLERSSPLFDAVVASRRTRHANQGPEVPVFEDRFQALVHSEGEIAGEVQAAFRVTSGARPGTVVTLFAGDAGARMAPGGNVLLHQILRPLSFSPLR